MMKKVPDGKKSCDGHCNYSVYNVLTKCVQFYTVYCSLIRNYEGSVCWKVKLAAHDTITVVTIAK